MEIIYPVYWLFYKSKILIMKTGCFFTIILFKLSTLPFYLIIRKKILYLSTSEKQRRKMCSVGYFFKLEKRLLKIKTFYLHSFYFYSITLCCLMITKLSNIIYIWWDRFMHVQMVSCVQLSLMSCVMWCNTGDMFRWTSLPHSPFSPCGLWRPESPLDLWPQSQ